MGAVILLLAVLFVGCRGEDTACPSQEETLSHFCACIRDENTCEPEDGCPVMKTIHDTLWASCDAGPFIDGSILPHGPLVLEKPAETEEDACMCRCG